MIITIDTAEKLVASEFFDLLLVEETMLRQRIERLQKRCFELFKEMRSKTVETFQILDESIGFVYKSEIDTAKNLVMIIKECIESEQKLSNQILLQTDKLIIDYSTLVTPPEVEQRPTTPQEKLTSLEQFTVSQLQRIGKDLFQISPTGIISIKAVAEYFVKLTIFAIGQCPLPEAFMGLDASKFQQILALLDPSDTGYINWKKFWLISAKILPLSLSELLELKQAYGTKLITKQTFMKIPLWFEKSTSSTAENSKPSTPQTPAFDRNQKLKPALFGNLKVDIDIFCKPKYFKSAVSPSDAVLNGFEAEPSSDLEPTLHTQEFLLLLCLDNQPSLALQKAFNAFQESNLGCTREQAYKPFSALCYYPKSSNRLDIDQVNTVYPPSIVSKVYEGTDKMPWEKFVELLKYYGGIDWLECRLYEIPDLTLK